MMASATAMSAARSMPAVYTIPLGPRVRPPRLLPGTKAENTNPQPEGAVPRGNVWVQGRWRNPDSNAAKDRKKVQSAQVEKALRHASHGMNIYAYRQIRTNQVVYSLSRVMQNNKILSQLVYHGKQTKPAALRRDVWRPYFSIHFPETSAGAQAGLDTYQMLRELSARRQLSPSKGSLLATKEDVADALKQYDPATLERMREEKDAALSKLPKFGQLLPPKYRAKKLMDHKKSSVADVAFALSLVNDSSLSPHDKLIRAQKRLKARHSDRSRRDRRRVNEIRRGHEAKEIQIDQRQKLIDAELGQLTLDHHAAARIALDHNGVLMAEDRVTAIGNAPSPAASVASSSNNPLGTKPKQFDVDKFKNDYTLQWEAQHEGSASKPPFPTEELEKLVQKRLAERQSEIKSWEQNAQQVRAAADADGQASRQVLVLWSDLKDAMNAEKWTSNVQHDWFDAKAVVKVEKSVVRQPAFVDEDGFKIEEQRHRRLFPVSSSPHIMGRDSSENWLSDAIKPAKEDTDQQAMNLARREHIVRRMIAVKSELKSLQQVDSHYTQSPRKEPSPAANESRESEKLASSKEEVELLRDRYPEYDDALERLEYFTDLIARHRELARKVEALAPGAKGRQELMSQEHALAKEVRDDCDTEFPGFSAAQRQHHKDLLHSQSEEQLKEIEADSTVTMVKTVLAHHQKLLERLGDESAVSAGSEVNTQVSSTATGSASRKMNERDLKDMNIEVDMQELDKKKYVVEGQGCLRQMNESPKIGQRLCDTSYLFNLL